MDLWSRRLFVTFGLAALGAGQATVSAAQGSKAGRLILKIHDTYPGMASGVRGDGARHETPTDPFSFYVDRLLTNPSPDPCVTAKLESSGLGFIWLDNNLTTDDCASQNGLTARTFVLQLPANACDGLGIGGGTPCTLRMNPGLGEEPLDHPRIRLSNLYSPKGKTPVAFLFLHPSGSYEVRSDQDIPFVKSGNTWTLTNAATPGGRSFSLWRIDGTSGSIASGFDLLFSIIANKQ